MIRGGKWMCKKKKTAGLSMVKSKMYISVLKIYHNYVNTWEERIKEVAGHSSSLQRCKKQHTNNDTDTHLSASPSQQAYNSVANVPVWYIFGLISAFRISHAALSVLQTYALHTENIRSVQAALVCVFVWWHMLCCGGIWIPTHFFLKKDVTYRLMHST